MTQTQNKGKVHVTKVSGECICLTTCFLGLLADFFKCIFKREVVDLMVHVEGMDFT